MQVIEVSFFFLIFVFILRLLVESLRSRVSSSHLVIVGLTLLVLSGIFEGLRWQLIPSYLAFSLLALGTLKRIPSKLRWRVLAVVPIAALLLISISLSSLFPVFNLPEPGGPYRIGTFNYSLVDNSRIERFEPTKNRELYVRVWYPSAELLEREVPVRTLWQDLYAGDYDLVSFFTNYLSQVETHSQIESAIAPEEQFPVLVFNHGMNAFPEQNTVLMEHLASHGYIIFSIAHTYQSTKVFLSSSEKILFTTRTPKDLGYAEDEDRPITGVRALVRTEDGSDNSLLDEQLFAIFDRYRRAASETEKRNLVEEVIRERERYLIGPGTTSDTLYNYFYGRMTAMGSFVQTWVEDIQFIVDEMTNINAPITGFVQALNTERLGVFGHSFGSSAAGEFCKLDDRCKAGIHMDGNQSGYNWDKPLLAPFLAMYSWYFFGGNDFAYKSSNHDFWNMTISGLDHMDFTDLGLAVRGLQGRGMMGDVDNEKALRIINQVALSFFDHYLKEAPMRTDLLQKFPELTLELFEK
ncbi:MAG TPA: hypothetical protein DCM64_11140 [Gammaproteobacteria bacterium]|nr:hypothetical protein [Gammaproteobacteria bacterium]MDP6768065.1 hypothetical protein [Arenicellales bacterium]HAJ76997.1 hypothetical protein [Gammaproteobacteria bacterium]